MELKIRQSLPRLNNQQPIVTVAEKLNLVKVKKFFLRIECIQYSQLKIS